MLDRGTRFPHNFLVLATEALAIAVRQDAKIKGISVGGEETKLLQYANDMTAVLEDASSAQALFDLLEMFKKASGLTINFTKTKSMWIGSCKNNKAKPLGIKWPSEPIVGSSRTRGSGGNRA